MRSLQTQSAGRNSGKRIVRLDPRRRRTEAEFRLFASVFGCSVESARKSLSKPISLEKVGEMEGMMAAIRLEAAVAKGKKLVVPTWLQDAMRKSSAHKCSESASQKMNGSA